MLIFTQYFKKNRLGPISSRLDDALAISLAMRRLVLWDGDLIRIVKSFTLFVLKDIIFHFYIMRVFI